MAKLNTNVNVDGTWYSPGVDVPDEVAAQITNPKVWDGDPPARERDVSQREDSAFQIPEKRRRIELEQVKEPPRGGPGSSTDAWRAFMVGQGFEVPEGASAKDMQAAWDARNED